MLDNVRGVANAKRGPAARSKCSGGLAASKVTRGFLNTPKRALAITTLIKMSPVMHMT